MQIGMLDKWTVAICRVPICKDRFQKEEYQFIDLDIHMTEEMKTSYPFVISIGGLLPTSNQLVSSQQAISLLNCAYKPIIVLHLLSSLTKPVPRF